MPRVIWKGAITFGLVHIPVNLYPGSTASALDLDLLDKRDYAPVGYRRVNKRTGKEVAPADTVKGFEYKDGQYVVLSEEDFRQANVKATQTVDILSFVDASGIPAYHFDTPYYLEPGKRGEKGYALLRETLRKSGLVGVANVPPQASPTLEPSSTCSCRLAAASRSRLRRCSAMLLTPVASRKRASNASGQSFTPRRAAAGASP